MLQAFALTSELPAAIVLPDTSAAITAAAPNAAAGQTWVTTVPIPAATTAPPPPSWERQPLVAWLSNKSPDGAHVRPFGR
jgi:hypothetical protein